MITPINNLPSRFKPYPFKSFKLRAISVKQAMDLGANPTLEDIQKLIGHSDFSTTANVYINQDIATLRKAVNSME